MNPVNRSYRSIALALASTLASFGAQAQAGKRAEVIVVGVDPARVKSALMNRIADSGYRLTQSSEFTLVAEKKLTDADSVIFLSNPGGGLADMRVTYTIAQSGDQAVRVVADVAKVTHSLVTDYTFDANDGPEVPVVQALLDLTAADLARAKPDKRGTRKRQ